MVIRMYKINKTKLRFKRIVVFVMLCAFIFSFSACGSKKEGDTYEKEQGAKLGQELEPSPKGQEKQKKEEQPSVASAEKLTKGDRGNQEVIDESILDDETKKTLYDASGKFSFELFKECDEIGENILISPASVMFALGMTANGGVGDTLKEMERVLGGEGANIGDINAFYREYAKKLENAEEIKISIANSIWINKDILTTAKEAFLSACDSFYGADVYRAVFNDETIKLVNKWVKENTDGMIKELLKEFNGDEAMMLINAIAFDGKWEKTYCEDQVRDTIFTTDEGEETSVQGMYSDERVYIEDENTTGFIKDYKGGYRFVALLPDENISIDEYVASLTYDKYKNLMESERRAFVSAMLPKFQYDYGKEMKDALKAMGMPSAFEPSKADFSNMIDDELVKLYIGKVLHKTHIEVGEEGTRAAAVTAVMMDLATEIIEEEKKEVFLNRPFVYMIIDEENEIPLFMGVVRNM